MSNLIPFDSALPAYLQNAGGAQNSDLSGGVSGGYPILSIKGKTWSLSQNGEKRAIMRLDERTGEPTDEPASALRVVIVKSNPHVSKIYYSGGYEEGSDAKPTCYSHDGISPAMDAEERQSEKCATCPLNVWGSRITENGSKGKACADSRRIAVSPSGDIGNPMLLRVPAASLRDLAAYATMLDKRRVPYNAVVTKLSFDLSVAYPKLVFKPEGFLSAEQFAQVQEVAEGDVVAQIISTSAPADGDELGELPAHLRQPAAPKPATTPKPAAAPKAAAPKPATAPKPAPKPAPIAEDDVSAALGGAPEPAAQAPAAASSDLSSDIADALGDALAALDD